MAIKLPGGIAILPRLLANRAYCLYVFGHWIGNIGLWIQRVAIGWLTWELSESTGWLGAMAFADQAPALLFGVFAGAVVDRVDYFKMLRLTQTLTWTHSAVLAALTLAGLMDIWLLLGLTVYRGVVTAFNRPSRMTVVYVLVGRDLLPSALAFNAMIFNSSRFIGPAVGGAILAVADNTGWAFIAAALTSFIFSLTLMFIRIGPLPARERQRESLFAEGIEGLRYAATHSGIGLQLGILVLASFFARPVTDLLPGFAAAIFARGSDGLAWFLTCHGLGAMAGGLWLTSRSSGIKGMTKVMVFSLLATGLSLLAFSQTTVFWLGCLLAGAIGASFVIQAISNQTLIQYAVDPAYRGRIGSVYGSIARGGPAVGALIMGVAADHLGLQIPVATGAIFCLLLWAWAWRRRAAMTLALECEPAVKTPKLAPELTVADLAGEPVRRPVAPRSDA